MPPISVNNELSLTLNYDRYKIHRMTSVELASLMQYCTSLLGSDLESEARKIVSLIRDEWWDRETHLFG